MNRHLRITSAVASLVLASSVFAQSDFYMAGAGTQNDKWNSASLGSKWTNDAGITLHNASDTAGHTYHTNGYTLRGGRIGDTSGGNPNPYVFSGPSLVIDGYNSASGVTDGGSGGVVRFDIAATPVGPRTAAGNSTLPTQANYVANIVVDAIGNTPGSEREILASNGQTTLDGTLRLNGPIKLTLPSGTNDVEFTIKSAVIGAGDIELSGGSAGGGTANGYVKWGFENLSGWKGSTITVEHKHTIWFKTDIDFTVTNPGAALAFPLTNSVGFLYLDANVSFASGKVTYGTSVLPDGTYTAAQLNAIWNTGGYATQPFADGPGTLTVKPVVSTVTAPSITSGTTTAGTTGVPFRYLITATGVTTSYSASPLPAGLSVDPTTGLISGTPTTAGNTTVTLGATNAGGTGNRTLTVTINAAVVVTNAYAAGNAGGATGNGWNDGAADTAYKWTTDGGVTYTTAGSGKSYHTNGYTVKAGRIGSPTNGATASGPEPYTTFAGDELIVDGYDSASGVSWTENTGALWFQLAGGDMNAAVGPRAGDATDTTTRGTYIGDIVTGATSGVTTRYIQGDTGRTTLDGVLTLKGNTVFWANSDDVYFQVKAPVHGTGNILLHGGPNGSSQVNGWLTFAFDNLSDWKGAAIKVASKMTLSFTGDEDFSATNPSAIIHFPTSIDGNATVGYLDLSANITVAPGQIGYGGLYESSTMTTTLTTPGTYTASDLNTYFGVSGFASGSGTVTVVPLMTLVSGGVANSVILTAPTPLGSVAKAALELQKHLQLITGATVPIDTVGNESLYSGKRFIYLGANTASTAAGISTASLPNEFYIIRTVGGNLHIVGKDAGTDNWTKMNDCQPGTMFGVYHFLSEVLGVRWLWPGDDGITYTPNTTLTLPTLDITSGPPLLQRHFRTPRVGLYVSGATTYGSTAVPVLPTSSTTRQALADEENLWLRRQMMGARKDPAFGHSETQWWDKYGATHPEYFAVLLPGKQQPKPSVTEVKLHVSGNATIQARVDDWVASGAPNDFNLCPNDSRAFCVCADCLAWDYPSQADTVVYNSDAALLGERYAHWYKEVANKAALINPNVTVYGYAYDVYKNPPQVTTLPSNVAIAYIPGSAADVDVSVISQTETNFQGWIDAGCTQMYLRPNWLLAGHAGPFLPVNRAGEHLKRLLGTGQMLGFDGDSSNSSYASFGLYFYAFAQEMEHPDRPMDQIIDEYCAGFGSASSRIRDYFQYWENFICNESDANSNRDILGYSTCVAAYDNTYTDAAFDGAEQILDSAEDLLGSGETDAAARIEFLRTAITHGRKTAKAIRLVDPNTPVNYNPEAQAALRDLLSYRDSQADTFTIWREWNIDREATLVPGMQAYWSYILANP